MIVKLLQRVFASGPYYIRINRERLSARDVDTGRVYEGKPCLEIDASNNVVSVGNSVSPVGNRIVNPFDHPRIVIDDFSAAEKVLGYAVRELTGTRYFMPSPVMVIHPDVELEGGISAVESRALLELAESCGARKARVHYGHQLTDQDVKDIAASDASIE